MNMKIWMAIGLGAVVVGSLVMYGISVWVS